MKQQGRLAAETRSQATSSMSPEDWKDDAFNTGPSTTHSPLITQLMIGVENEPTEFGTVRAGLLKPFLTCNLCAGYLRDPYLLTCCLFRRYCKDCLIRNLRQRDSRCPNEKCQHYIGAKLSSVGRPDIQLKDLMVKLLPQVLEDERSREEAFYREQGPSCPFSPSVQFFPRVSRPANEQQAKQRVETSVLDTPLDQDLIVLCLPLLTGDCVNEEMVLDKSAKITSALPPLELPYLKVQRRTLVSHLCHVLVASLNLEVDSSGAGDIELLCRGKAIPGHHSLYFIERTVWGSNGTPLTLHYQKKKVVRKG